MKDWKKEARFNLDEDSICYGCDYYKHRYDVIFDHYEDDYDENDRCCDCPHLCVNSSENSYYTKNKLLNGKNMQKDNIVHAVPINEGMKIFMTDEKSFLEANRQLNEYGFITRCNPEQWSIYIVSAPYERDDGVYCKNTIKIKF